MPIHYEKNPTGTDEHLVLITIDRPEAKNALDMYHFRDLAGAWKQFRYDDEAWVAIVTGVERNFMAGADLKTYIPQITELSKQISTGEVTEVDGCRLSDGTRAVLRDTKIFKPIIAAVNGPCVAGGMEMLGGIDIRIATANAKFGVMEPKRGLFAGGGTTARLPRQLAFPAAMEFLLTAEAFPAERALELGLLNELVAEDELLDRGLRLGAPDLGQRTARGSSDQGERPARHVDDARRGLRHRTGAQPEDLPVRGRQGRPEGVCGKARPRSGRRSSGAGHRPSFALLDRRRPAHVASRRGRVTGTRTSGDVGGSLSGRHRRHGGVRGRAGGAPAHRHRQDRVLPELPVRRSGAAPLRAPRDRSERSPVLGDRRHGAAATGECARPSRSFAASPRSPS